MDSSLDKLVIIHHAEPSTVLSTRVFSDVITQLLDCPPFAAHSTPKYVIIHIYTKEKVVTSGQMSCEYGNC